MLAGLCKQHTGTQVAAISAVEKIHLLEQVSTEKHLGTLAENVLETMMENTECQRKVCVCVCVCVCVRVRVRVWCSLPARGVLAITSGLLCGCLSADQGSSEGNTGGEETQSHGSEEEGARKTWHARRSLYV